MTDINKLGRWLTSPIGEGDTFYRKVNGVEVAYLALGVRGTEMICCTKGKDDRLDIKINDPANYKKDVDYKGANPFINSNIRFSNFGIDSIFSYIGIDREGKKVEDLVMPYFNWDPYFIIDGKKEHYQRGYVWTLEQKQALIDTIYRGLDCGRCIVHVHDFNDVVKKVKEGFTDYACRDIVDGKQRLSTIVQFYRDEFEDAYGNKYSELSNTAQRKFLGYSGLSYGELDDKCSPEQVCEAFLTNAVAGTPISAEHVNYMIKLKETLNK